MPRDSAPTPRRRRWWILGALVVALLLAAAVAIAYSSFTVVLDPLAPGSRGGSPTRSIRCAFDAATCACAGAVWSRRSWCAPSAGRCCEPTASRFSISPASRSRLEPRAHRARRGATTVGDGVEPALEPRSRCAGRLRSLRRRSRRSLEEGIERLELDARRLAIAAGVWTARPPRMGADRGWRGRGARPGACARLGNQRPRGRALAPARRDDRPGRLVRGRQRRDPGRGLVRRRLRARAPSPRSRARARRCRARADRAAAFDAGVARGSRSEPCRSTRASPSTRASWWSTRSRSVSRESAHRLQRWCAATRAGRQRRRLSRPRPQPLGFDLSLLAPLSAPLSERLAAASAGAHARRGHRHRGEPGASHPARDRARLDRRGSLLDSDRHPRAGSRPGSERRRHRDRDLAPVAAGYARRAGWPT